MGNKIVPSDRVLITGGGGYLGSKLAERMARIGCGLYLVDIRFNDLANALSQKWENVHLERLNLTDRLAVAERCNDIRPDIIFHFASAIDRSRNFAIYDHLYNVNVKGTLYLLEGLKEIPYKELIFSSTCEVYGKWRGVPFKEDSLLNPVSPYSLTKMYCEKMIQLFSDIHGKSFKILRIFNFYGQDMPNSTFIGQMTESFKKGQVFEMTRGEQARDLLPIEDLLNQVVFVSERNSDYSIFNICSGRSFKMVEIAEGLKEITNGEFNYSTNLPYRANEVWETRGDNSRIRELGFLPSNFSLMSMLKRSLR